MWLHGACADDTDSCNDDSYFHHTLHYQGWGDVRSPPPPSEPHAHLEMPLKTRACHQPPCCWPLKFTPRFTASSSRHAPSAGPALLTAWPLEIAVSSPSTTGDVTQKQTVRQGAGFKWWSSSWGHVGLSRVTLQLWLFYQVGYSVWFLLPSPSNIILILDPVCGQAPIFSKRDILFAVPGH